MEEEEEEQEVEDDEEEEAEETEKGGLGEEQRPGRTEGGKGGRESENLF